MARGQVACKGFSTGAALYTGDHDRAGVCTREPAATVQTPSGTTSPVRKPQVAASGHCTNPCRNTSSSAHGPALYTGAPVRAGVCTLGFSTGATFTRDFSQTTHTRLHCVPNGNHNAPHGSQTTHTRLDCVRKRNHTRRLTRGTHLMHRARYSYVLREVCPPCLISSRMRPFVKRRQRRLLMYSVRAARS